MRTVAIGIPSSGLELRFPGNLPDRGALRRERDTPFVRDVDRAAFVVEGGAVDERAPRVGVADRVVRVERAGGSAAGGVARNGIAAYLGVERGTALDSSGGELVGIDFYV